MVDRNKAKIILEHHAKGLSYQQIGDLIGCSKSAVRHYVREYGDLTGLEQRIEKSGIKSGGIKDFKHWKEILDNSKEIQSNYAYILGMYLGDGYINKEPRTYRIRITLDAKYPKVIERCQQELENVLIRNKVSIVESPFNCVDVSAYNKSLPLLFPQYGKGAKHTRKIELSDWQQEIVDNYRIPFLEGLYHSDGCRDSNFVSGKSYPRYSFSNTSNDIMNLFVETVESLGLPTTSCGKTARSIAKRKHVKYLDSVLMRKQ